MSKVSGFFLKASVVEFVSQLQRITGSTNCLIKLWFNVQLNCRIPDVFIQGDHAERYMTISIRLLSSCSLELLDILLMVIIKLRSTDSGVQAMTTLTPLSIYGLSDLLYNLMHVMLQYM